MICKDFWPSFENVSNSFNINFDPEQQIQEFTLRTICVVNIDGYREHPDLLELIFIDKNGVDKVDYYKKTLIGKILMTRKEVKEFYKNLSS